jgi:hypothetical protein
MAAAMVTDDVVVEEVMEVREWIEHQTPVWGEQSDFIISVELDPDVSDARKRYEQLWAKQIDEHRFRLCCIPFFAYDLALGDEVETQLKGEQRYMVCRVVRDSGNYTFRIWFGESDDPTVRKEVTDECERQDWLFEWYSRNLLAISVGSARAQEVADYLYQQQQLGRLLYETGRSE